MQRAADGPVVRFCQRAAGHANAALMTTAEYALDADAKSDADVCSIQCTVLVMHLYQRQPSQEPVRIRNTRCMAAKEAPKVEEVENRQDDDSGERAHAGGQSQHLGPGS